MDWAESEFPAYFPSHFWQIPWTLQNGPYNYRYYADTDTYLGVAGGEVYVLGPLSGGVLLQVGSLSQFACAVLAGQCDFPNVLDTVTMENIAGRYFDGDQDVTINRLGAIKGLATPGCWVNGQVISADAKGTVTMRARFAGGACWANNLNETPEGIGTYIFQASASSPVGIGTGLTAYLHSASARVTTLQLHARKALAASDRFNFEIHYVVQGDFAYLEVIRPLDASLFSGSFYPTELMTDTVDVWIDTVGGQSRWSPSSQSKYDPRYVYRAALPPGFTASASQRCVQAEIRVTDTQGLSVMRNFPLCPNQSMDMLVDQVVDAPDNLH